MTILANGLKTQEVVRGCINCGSSVVFIKVGNQRVPVNAEDRSKLHYDHCKHKPWWWGEFIRDNRAVVQKMFPNRRGQ